MSEDAEVIVRVEGQVGRITLNRPQALHALTTAICRQMIAALSAWRDDPAVQLVMIDHAGERGFCAGGDIRTLAESGQGDGVLGREFFFVEYRLNHLLFHYPKPVVAFMDGVVMGGGVGISRPARFRVGTERTTFAMPETGIGLFPDVGGSWYLARMPDHIGMWLALTGARLKAADCRMLGLITDYVPAARLAELKAALVARPGDVEHLLSAYEGEPPAPTIPERRAEIRAGFGGDSVEAICADLEALTAWGREQLATLRAKSPTSLKVAFRQLKEGARAKTFAEVMAMEYRIAHRLAVSHDFLEGVRAVILDKDNQPKWAPPSLEAVSTAAVDAIFAPLPARQEWSPLQEEVAA